MAKSVVTKLESSSAYTPLAGVGIKSPTHDITLKDIDGTTAGLILANRSGRQDPRGMQFASMPRTALQTSQGNGGYDDMLPPFVTEVQNTFIGGRAQDSLSTDRTRFADSYRLDTTKEFPICAPKVSAQTGLVPDTNIDLHDTKWGYLSAVGAPLLCEYLVSSDITVTGFTILINQATPNMRLYYSVIAADSPPSYASYDTAAEQMYSIAFNADQFPFSLYLPIPATAVASGKNFYIVLFPEELIQVITISEVSGATVYVGPNWVFDKVGYFPYSTIHTETESDVKLFEYKRQLYAALNATNKTSAELYMNGWRGVADVNASYSVLADATQTGWANNSAKDCIVLIINGTGESEAQPWRRIVSSASGVLTLSTPWKIKPDTTTEYVVLGSDKWFAVSTMPAAVEYFGKAVTAIAPVKDYIVFAFGDGQYLSYYRNGQVAGAFAENWAMDAAYKADLLCPIVNEFGDLKLWRADCDDCWVDCSDVPDWLTPWTSPPTLLFDVNAHERADLLLQQQRAVKDWDTENAKADKDAGYLKSLERTILDLEYQLVYVPDEEEATGTGPNVLPDSLTYITTAASTAHKYLPMKVYCGNTNARITNIIGYGQPEIPYILKEDSFGSVYNNVYQEMPIGEMASVRSEVNGEAGMQFGVYLYFNLAGGMLERYYDQRLDDIGPNRDEGLPIGRQGEIVKILPYPGRFYAAINAGFDGYSSVLCNNMLGWHELYRSSTSGSAIKDIYVQSIPGYGHVDRLWISEGSDLVALPVSVSPLSQSLYPYFGYRDPEGSGYVETSWIDFDLKDVEKYFHSVTLFSDYSGDVETGNEYEINVYFKVDGHRDWTYGGRAKAAEIIDGKLQVGVKEIELRYVNPTKSGNNVSGKKIKFRIYLTPMASEYETPRLKAVLVNAVLRMPIKRSWNITFMLEPMEDLQHRQLTDPATLLYNQLYTWANSKTHATPLLMRSNDALADNKYVFIDPASISPFQALSQMSAGSGQKEYRHLATMTIYEV